MFESLIFTSRSVTCSILVLLVLHIIDFMWNIFSLMITARTRSNMSNHIHITTALTVMFTFWDNKLHLDPSSLFRMLRHSLVRWTLRVAWTLMLCCISLSVYEPEQCSRWDSNVWLSSSIPSHVKTLHVQLRQFFFKQLNNFNIDYILDSTIPVCNMAVWNWVQRKWLHCCCDCSQPRYPQGVRWIMIGHPSIVLEKYALVCLYVLYVIL